ncbi:MAG TPA: heme ABC exporter ATP-binding protein CcmA [Thermoguttaceae bacterium]|nr:heme ABC exporter ATP-binding protein CcmA [Thermoguttaceae bacterium]
MTEPTVAIRARGLSRLFGNRLVLHRVDLDVAEGQSVALTGANGAGKTTLLRCLASVLRPNTGEVRWFGQLATADPSTRRSIAMVSHESFLYPHLTLRENLIFAGRMCDVGEPTRRADELLARIDLSGHAHRLPPQISRGMRQRVAVARALVHQPRILLLDEPFSGLDARGTDWLLGLLQGLHARGRTLCFATHDQEKVRRLADRVLELRSGRVEEVAVDESSVSEEAPALRAA